MLNHHDTEAEKKYYIVIKGVAIDETQILILKD